jgi:nitrate/nitrite-specific signal transduction histidine kinase
MVLALSVAGVSALLRRKVFVPLRELVDYAVLLRDGKLDAPCPRGVEEIETLGAILHCQAQTLEDYRRRPHAVREDAKS